MRDTCEIHVSARVIKIHLGYIRIHPKYMMRYMYLKCIQREMYLICLTHPWCARIQHVVPEEVAQVAVVVVVFPVVVLVIVCAALSLVPLCAAPAA